MEAHHAQATATGDLPASATSAMTETRKLAAILMSDIAATPGLLAWRMRIDFCKERTDGTLS
jgi:hypothetical protein